MRHAFAVLILATTPALAQDVPSGQPVELHEVLVDEVGVETWVRFRFVAPQIAREGGSITFVDAEPDMQFLCDTLALPYIDQYALTGDVIVISLSDRPTEFGQADSDATQFFDAYRPDGASCVWEPL